MYKRRTNITREEWLKQLFRCDAIYESITKKECALIGKPVPNIWAKKAQKFWREKLGPLYDFGIQVGYMEMGHSPVYKEVKNVYKDNEKDSR